jgi:L-rhamnose mutarotase
MTTPLTPFRCVAGLLLLVTLIAAAGFKKTENVERYGAVIGVKPEKLEYYKKLHADPWPSVNKAVKQANIRNYSIYLTQFDDGRWYLFGYFEYTGGDFEADMKKLAGNDEVKRWWKETDPCQIGLKSRKEGEWWKSMEEVYHLD